VLFKLILASLLMVSTSLIAAPTPLRFAINDSWGMPMVRIENDQAVEGILVDLQRRLAAKVGREAKLVVLPHMRVARALDTGDIDVRCYVSPSWINSGHRRFIWTRSFMIQRDLLVSFEPHNLHPEELINERLGTVLGFTYPRLTHLFESGQIQREDTRTQDQALLKLSAKRYRFAITNERSLIWFNRQRPPEQQIHISSEIASVPVSCIVRNDPDVPTTELLRAMDQMGRDGEFERIIDRYN
jgi:polar amino acid transport system substrate-binding protein